MLALNHPNVRTLVAGARAAVRTGASLCSIRLTDGSVHDFRITEVLDDALLGARVNAPDKACLVSFHSIAMMEFG